jgi:hypothetical protein
MRDERGEVGQARRRGLDVGAFGMSSKTAPSEKKLRAVTAMTGMPGWR